MAQVREFSKCNGTVTVVPNSAQEMEATSDHGDHKIGVVSNVLESKFNVQAVEVSSKDQKNPFLMW